MLSVVLGLARSVSAFATEHVRVPFSPAAQSELVKFQQILKAQPTTAVGFSGQTEFVYAQAMRTRHVLQWVKADTLTGTVNRWAFELSDEGLRPVSLVLTASERAPLENGSSWVSVMRDFGSYRLRQEFAVRLVNEIPFPLMVRSQREGANGLQLIEVDKANPRLIRVFTPKGLGQLVLGEAIAGDVVNINLDLSEGRLEVFTTALIKYGFTIKIQDQVLNFDFNPSRSMKMDKREVAAQMKIYPATCSAILK
jgi:hypothetical protein